MLARACIAHVLKTVPHIMEDHFVLRYVLIYSGIRKQRLICLIKKLEIQQYLHGHKDHNYWPVLRRSPYRLPLR